MAGVMEKHILDAIAEHQDVSSAMAGDASLIAALQRAAQACIECLRNGGKTLLAGNGGSAADAQHIAGELVSRFASIAPGLHR